MYITSLDVTNCNDTFLSFRLFQCLCESDERSELLWALIHNQMIVIIKTTVYNILIYNTQYTIFITPSEM